MIMVEEAPRGTNGKPPTEAVLAFSSFPVEDFHGHAR